MPRLLSAPAEVAPLAVAAKFGKLKRLDVKRRNIVPDRGKLHFEETAIY